MASRTSETLCEVVDDDGNMTSPACGFVRGLRAAGVPVCVLDYVGFERHREEWEQRLISVATGKNNEVCVGLCV
jgi:hypothetical protein